LVLSWVLAFKSTGRKCDCTSLIFLFWIGSTSGYLLFRRYTVGVLLSSSYRFSQSISKKKSLHPDAPRAPCPSWLSRRIEGKLVFWVCGLLLGACRQGSMTPGRTGPNQGLRRYPTKKRFSRRKKVLRTQPDRIVE